MGMQQDLAVEPSGPSVLQEAMAWGRDALLAVSAGIALVIFVVQPVQVEGTSMAPRLEQEDRVLVNKLAYQVGEVSRGDIVVFWYPRDTSKSFIKRVIGLPGDIVEIRAGAVFLNNRKFEEPYTPESMTGESHPARVVPAGHYYVLGDNRSASNDSREWGGVPEGYVLGEAVFRYWPLWRAGGID